MRKLVSNQFDINTELLATILLIILVPNKFSNSISTQEISLQLHHLNSQ